MTEQSPSITEILANRTRYITVVTEDLYQSHNGAAVMRACDGFGVQEVHAICNRNPFLVSEEIVGNARHHVDVHRYDQPSVDNTTACLTDLKQQGYRIFATTLREGCVPIHEVPLDQPLALCFGTELKGLSETAHQLADGYVRLPMFGFTQSFNISVSTALSLFDLTSRLRASDFPWPLSPEDQESLRQKWETTN